MPQAVPVVELGWASAAGLHCLAWPLLTQTAAGPASGPADCSPLPLPGAAC